MSTPRIVVVHRRTEYAELIARHGTRGQAVFFLATRDKTLSEVEARHVADHDARATVGRAIPLQWRRAEVERGELARFVFGPDDIIVVVGQDGLVANVAKYLTGQPVIGVNPLPGVNAGVLVPHAPSTIAGLLEPIVAGQVPLLARTMVSAHTDDGQSLVALNEIYIGQPTHQSARYRLAIHGVMERQSSSGVIVGTGTGASGWCASLARVQAPTMRLPAPDEAALVWFVREAWPSPSTQVSLVAGLSAGDGVILEVDSDRLVCFGDGIEEDHLVLGAGQRVTLGVSARRLNTVG